MRLKAAEDISQLFQICADTERYTRARRDPKQDQKIINQTNESSRDRLDDHDHPFTYVDNHSLLTALDTSRKAGQKSGYPFAICWICCFMFAISILRC